MSSFLLHRDSACWRVGGEHEASAAAKCTLCILKTIPTPQPANLVELEVEVLMAVAVVVSAEANSSTMSAGREDKKLQPEEGGRMELNKAVKLYLDPELLAQ